MKPLKNFSSEIFFNFQLPLKKQLDERELFTFGNISGKNKEFMKRTQEVTVINLSKIILDNEIKEIDILKIDTEGFEYNILKGIENFDFTKIKYIYIEHHFDLMINKGYKLSDINMLLNKNNFYKKYKLKMKFRKSFEYIYENEKR